jgi:hypothetical protein
MPGQHVRRHSSLRNEVARSESRGDNRLELIGRITIAIADEDFVAGVESGAPTNRQLESLMEAKSDYSRQQKVP